MSKRQFGARRQTAEQRPSADALRMPSPIVSDWRTVLLLGVTTCSATGCEIVSLSENKVTTVSGSVQVHETISADESAFLATAGSVDWEAIVDSFAAQHDMTFAEVLQWVSERTSLQVACEVFGVALSPSISSKYTVADVDLLCSLGDLLWAREYEVPRLMEHRRLEYSTKGREEVGFSLSREEYLRERATGKSKKKIAREQGISGPALFHWLGKWGLKDASIEQQEILQLDMPSSSEDWRASHSSASSYTTPEATRESDNQTNEEAIGQMPMWATHEEEFRASHEQVLISGPKSSLPATSFASYAKHRLQVVPRELSDHTEPSSPMETSDMLRTCAHPTTSTGLGSHPMEAETPRATSATIDGQQGLEFMLRLPIGVCDVPENIRPSHLGREELMHTSLALLQRAITEAHQDLSRLLGEEAATQQIQHYVAHQVKRYISSLE